MKIRAALPEATTRDLMLPHTPPRPPTTTCSSGAFPVRLLGGQGPKNLRIVYGWCPCRLLLALHTLVSRTAGKLGTAMISKKRTLSNTGQPALQAWKLARDQTV